VKHRSLAAELVEGGHVRINSTRISKTSHMVKPDDVITLALYNDVKVVKILAEAEKRGGAPQARLLYQDLSTQKMDA
jgi:ribosome-associated heat shock protein Hsp15